MCAETFKEVDVFLKEANDASDLIELLHKIQDFYGYIPKEVLPTISRYLNIPVSKIYGVITFYARFSMIPKGKNIISVCMGTACYVKGAEEILNKISELLHIEIGETTEDLQFSLVETRCLGECAYAPVVNINDKTYPNVTVDEVPNILAEAMKGDSDE